MSVVQVDYQAAEAAINKNLFHSSLLLPFADQSENPLRSSTNWGSYKPPVQSKAPIHDCTSTFWVVLQHASEKSQPTPVHWMCLHVSFLCGRKINNQKLLNKQNKANNHNRNNCTILCCFFFLLILFAVYFCSTMMTRIHHHKIIISLMCAKFG